MATAATKLSARDCKDLEKYLRYLVYKSVQVIVQSRQGEKISVPSKQFSTGVDWFNLTIRDSADVLTEVKRVYPGTTGGLVAGVTVCIETVLRMNNGDAIQLETWYIRMVPETDAPAKISYTVYGRIGTLLKSLLVATRCVPVYRLSRRWGESNSECNICYRVYVGDPVFDLGSAYRSQIVGLVPTPVGTVSLSVAYRTQLSFSPTRQDHTVLEVREDHFCFDQKVVSGSIHIPCRHPVSSCQSDDADAVSEHNMPMLSPSTPDLKKASPTHTNALSVNRHDFSANANVELEVRKTTTLQPTSALKPDDASAVSNQRKLADNSMGDALKCIPGNKSDKLAECGLQAVTAAVINGSPGHEGTEAPAKSTDLPAEYKPPLDDKSNKEVEGDLGKFYRECRSAPALTMFQQPAGNLRDLLSSISDQLALFEANAKEFDDFVNSFPDC